MNLVVFKLVVTLAAVLYIVDFAACAAVKSEEFVEQLRRLIYDVYPDSLRTQRATESGNDDKPKRNCYDTPCGWNQYRPVRVHSHETRRSTIFMANKCKCPDETYKCVRTGENVSMGAYVYHCRQNTTAEDIVGESSYDMDW